MVWEVHRCGVWLAGHGGDHRSGVPIGADRDDFAIWIALDYVDAFEDDVFAVAAATEAGPLHGGGVAYYEDVIFGESDGFKDREDSGQELTKGVVSDQRRCADGVVALGVGREGVDPAVDVHGAQSRKVFSDGLPAGDGWHLRIVCRSSVFGWVAISECQLIECGGRSRRPELRWFRRRCSEG
jgi:hypothetical protein